MTDNQPTTPPGEALMALLGHKVPPAPPRTDDWLRQALKPETTNNSK